VILIVFGLIAVPKMLRNRAGGEGEIAAIAVLKQIHTAQADLFGASRMYGSMQRLSNSKLIQRSQDSFKELGYEFYHSTDGRGSTWCATAIPESGKSGRRFGIDESGSVYEGVSVNACYMGSLDRSGGSVVK
jgi:hypothetical protein